MNKQFRDFFRILIHRLFEGQLPQGVSQL